MLEICTLASGSSGNCTYISDGKTRLLIDAGISTRAIVNGLKKIGASPEEIDAILITHEHFDHVRALEVLEKKFSIPVYAAEPDTQAAVAGISDILYERTVGFPPGSEFSIGNINIKPFATPHDTPYSVGYRIESGENSLVFATDLGHVPEDVLNAMCGAQLILLEANYDEAALERGPYPPMLKKRIAGRNGHLSNSDCAKCAVEAAKRGVKCVVLGHLSKENNTPKLAYDTVHRGLMEGGFIPGVDVMLQVAPRSECGNIYRLESAAEEIVICGK